MKALRVLSLVAALLLLASQPAQAHAQLVQSTPRVSQVINKMPSQVSLTFDDNLIPLAGSNLIVVQDSKNKRVDKSDSKLVATTLTVSLKANLPVGTYHVTYHVISADGHPVTNSFYFYYRKK